MLLGSHFTAEHHLTFDLKPARGRRQAYWPFEGRLVAWLPG